MTAHNGIIGDGDLNSRYMPTFGPYVLVSRVKELRHLTLLQSLTVESFSSKADQRRRNIIVEEYKRLRQIGMGCFETSVDEEDIRPEEVNTIDNSCSESISLSHESSSHTLHGMAKPTKRKHKDQLKVSKSQPLKRVKVQSEPRANVQSQPTARQSMRDRHLNDGTASRVNDRLQTTIPSNSRRVLRGLMQQTRQTPPENICTDVTHGPFSLTYGQVRDLLDSQALVSGDIINAYIGLLKSRDDILCSQDSTRKPSKFFQCGYSPDHFIQNCTSRRPILSKNNNIDLLEGKNFHG
jgi:hypothetical protein